MYGGAFSLSSRAAPLVGEKWAVRVGKWCMFTEFMKMKTARTLSSIPPSSVRANVRPPSMVRLGSDQVISIAQFFRETGFVQEKEASKSLVLARRRGAFHEGCAERQQWYGEIHFMTAPATSAKLLQDGGVEARCREDATITSRKE